MTLFQQVRLADGSMPSTHIAFVTSVSFSSPQMGIEIISKIPSVRIPQLVGSKEAIVYYHPGVPYDGTEYDPKVSMHPPIPCEYVSARYFMVGEKVSVIQNGQSYFVVGDVYPQLGQSHRNYVAPDIEHRDWLSQLNGAVSWKVGSGLGNQLERVFLLANGDLVQYNFTTDAQYLEAYTGYYGGFYPCYHLWYGYEFNEAYPIAVGINSCIVHLTSWTWGRGDYNYVHTNVPRQRFFDETIEVPSFLFPTSEPAIRLEIQASIPAPTTYPILSLPDIEFYVTGSDIGYGLGSRTLDSSSYRDFTSLDDYVHLVETRTRPWGSQPTNTQKWETLNWTPNILICPVEGSGSSKLTYGFIDYVKEDYDGYDRESKGNTLHLLTGTISVTENPEFLGKSQLDVNDYNVSSSRAHEILTSSYQLQVINTGTGAALNDVTQTISMNTNLESGVIPDQLFTICSDGTNTFKKFPIVLWSKREVQTGDAANPVATTEVLTLQFEHLVNGLKVFTSSFTYSPNDGAPQTQRLYYLFHVDLQNKLFIADVYEYDRLNSDAQSISRIAIDGNAQREYTIWTYTPFVPYVPDVVNIPPWGDEIGFPEFPADDFSGVESYIYDAKVWKLPFYTGLNFSINTTPDSKCSINSTSYALVTGSNYPLGPLDEDIRSILLLATVHYEGATTSYIQAKEHVYIKPRRNGWLAYGQCCLDPDSGVIDYPYGSDVIKNIDGLVTDASELYSTSPENINVY